MQRVATDWRRLASLAVAAGVFLLLLSGFQLSSPAAALPVLRRIFVDVADPQALVAHRYGELQEAAETNPGEEVPVPSLPLVVRLPAGEVLSADTAELAELVTQEAAARLYQGGLPAEAFLGPGKREVVAPRSVRASLEVTFLLLNETTHRLLGVGLGITGVLLATVAWSAARGRNLTGILRVLGLGLALGVVPLVVGSWGVGLLLERAATAGSDAGAVAAVRWMQSLVDGGRDVLRPFLGLAVALLLGSWWAGAPLWGEGVANSDSEGC